MLWRFWATAVPLVALACSSSPKSTEASPPPEPPDTQVFDACMGFAAKLCASAEGCCQQAYSDFDQQACVDGFEREICHPSADAVAAGRAEFDDSAIEDCLAAHAESHAVCFPTWSENLALRKRLYGACHMIEGLTEIGRGCSIAATCKRPEGVATVACIKSQCVAIAVLPEGAECPYPQGDVSVCDEGLTCDAALGELGHCVPSIATGSECNGKLLEGTECGLGNYCDPETSTCQLTTNMGGSGCAQGTECVSFDCDRLAAECAPAAAMVSRGFCLGKP
jgi:hypothetical protein